MLVVDMGKLSKRVSLAAMDWSRNVPTADKGLCILCKHAAVDDADPTIARLGRPGRFEENGHFYLAHRNCLYASPSLGENDVNRPDIAFGFSPSSVLKEARRGKSLTCYLCKQKGAVHGCSVKKCRKSFHLYCAVKCNLLCMFKTSHAVYCEVHACDFLNGTDFVNEENTKPNNAGDGEHAPNDCCMCKMPLFENDAFQTVGNVPLVGDPRVQLSHNHVKNAVDTTKNWLAMRLTCCKRSDRNAAEDYVHRWCLERYSERKGMNSLKCPKCHKHETFIAFLTRNGIFLEDKCNDDDIPINRYEKCTADECIVSKFENEAQNRAYKEEEGELDMGECSECGRSLHAKCAFFFPRSAAGSRNDEDNYFCQMCFDKLKGQSPSTPAQSSSSLRAARKSGSRTNACRTEKAANSKVRVPAEPSRKPTGNRRERSPDSLSSAAVNASLPSSRDGDAGNESRNLESAEIDDKNIIAERNVRAESDSSSFSSVSSVSSLSSVRSALSVVSTTSSGPADDNQPNKRVKLNDGAEYTAGSSSSSYAARSRMRASAGSRQETLAALATAGLGEERHIRFVIKSGKLLSAPPIVTESASSSSSACPTCHRGGEARTFCTIGTQTDAVNILPDAVAGASSSISSSSASIASPPPPLLPTDSAIIVEDKTSSISGSSTSSSSPARPTAQEIEQVDDKPETAAAVGSQPMQQVDVEMVDDDDDADITFEYQVYAVNDDE